MTNFKTLTIAVLATTGFAISAPSFAAVNIGEQVETQIRISDLETEQGLATVYEQLRETAAVECGVDRRMTLSDRRAVESCAANLLEDFVESVGDDRLTRIHEDAISG